MTWAQVAGKNMPKKKPQALSRQKPPSDKIRIQVQVPEDRVLKFHHAERRTQVIRRAPPGTTTSTILQDLAQQFNEPLQQYVEAVVQDDFERRRFYIKYRTIEARRNFARKGFAIGDIQIPPENADVKGYIPNVPHTFDKQDVVDLLQRYGTIVSADFVTFEETGIRIGGFNFELNLHENAKLPNQIVVLNDSITINTSDDRRICSYCDNLGHLRRHCRKRLVDQMQRANEQFDAEFLSDFNMDTEDITTTTTPQTTPSTTSLVTSSTFVPTQALRNAKPQVSGGTKVTQSVIQPRPYPPVSTAVAFVQGESLAMEYETPATQTGPSTSNSTQPLEYPASYEQQQERVEESSSEGEETPPPKRNNVDTVEAYHQPPAPYIQHLTNPYDEKGVRIRGEEPPRLSQDQKQRFTHLFRNLPELKDPELEEYHTLRVHEDSMKYYIHNSLLEPFKKIAQRRWKLHFSDLRYELTFGGATKLKDNQEEQLYLQCVRRVRADLEITEPFKRHWNDLCYWSGMFNKYRVSRASLQTMQ